MTITECMKSFFAFNAFLYIMNVIFQQKIYKVSFNLFAYSHIGILCKVNNYKNVTALFYYGFIMLYYPRATKELAS